MALLPKLPGLAGELLLCRGCLGALGAGSGAGLCGRCWSGLLALPEGRCGACALVHAEGEACPDPVAWGSGDALWDYHGGRPPLGALLVPGIKGGEAGWRRALLDRAAAAPLPAWAARAELVLPAPTVPWRRWWRGFDLASEWGELLGRRLGRPVRPLLRKAWLSPRQAERSATARRTLREKAFRLADPGAVKGRRILLADDVWTTGTTLLRCARLLARAGAAEVAVLCLFRAT